MPEASDWLRRVLPHRDAFPNGDAHLGEFPNQLPHREISDLVGRAKHLHLVASLLRRNGESGERLSTIGGHDLPPDSIHQLVPGIRRSLAALNGLRAERWNASRVRLLFIKV